MDEQPPTILSYATQPVGTTIVSERIEGGVRFTDPPTSELIGVIGFGVLMVVLTCAWIARIARDPAELFFAVGIATLVLLVVVWLGVAWLIRSRLRMGQLPTTLSVTHQQIVLTRPTAFGLRRQVWQTSDAFSIYPVKCGTSVDLRALGFLRVLFMNGREIRVFADHTMDELEWVFRELRPIIQPGAQRADVVASA